jgi:Tfp pilus assembly protein PilF
VKNPTIWRRAGLALVLSVAVVPALNAAQRRAQPKAPPQAPAAQKSDRPQLAEKTSEALQKLGPMQQLKPVPYAEMLALVDGVLATVPPTSYDAAFLLNIKARVLLGMDKYAEAVPAWEQVIKLADQFGYIEPKEINEIALYLAQIIFSEAGAIKDLQQQRQQVARSSAYMKRHLENNPKPAIETQIFYAQLLYQQAVVDQNNVDRELLREARDVINLGMQATLQPREGFYMLLLAIYQQENDMVRSAELLELLVKKFPQKRDYWPLLMATYLNIASTEQDEVRRRDLYIRAINSLERAQSLGFMQTPKDNYNLVTIYLTAGQFSKATDILHAGLNKGTIESTLANWRLLGSYYQQAERELHAVEALKEAGKLFPNEGMLDLQIGEIYRQLEKTREAREFYRSALKKGNLDKPQVVHQLLAYTSMELDDWDAALESITEAAKHPEFAKEQQMVNLKKHIEETVAQRDEEKKLKAEAEEKKKA